MQISTPQECLLPSLENAKPFWNDFYSCLKQLLKINVFAVRLYRMAEIFNFFSSDLQRMRYPGFSIGFISSLPLPPPGEKKPNPKHQKHVPHYPSPLCPHYKLFIRPAIPLATHLQEVTPGKGKKKPHFHKQSYFKGQIITSGLKTVSDKSYKEENKRFCDLYIL